MSGRRRVLSICATLGVLGAGATVGWILLHDRTPELTRDALASARALWERAQLRDYDITIRKDLDARPRETIQTRVRGGKATRLLINGAEVAPKDSYSVPGLFELVEGELDLLESRERLPGQPEIRRLRGSFHPTIGVPILVRRIASRRQSYVIQVLHIETPEQLLLWKEP